MIDVENVVKILEEEKILKEKNCNENLKIEFLSYDSREIKPNTLFFCKGDHYKPEYLNQAINDGAIIYVSEQKYDADVPYIIVSDINIAMAKIAAGFYDFAHRDLKIIGVTGTKGKTTTTTLIHNVLDEYTQKETALSTTIYTYTGTTSDYSHLTTPEAVDLHKFYYEARENNCEYMTMEISAQAYKRNRVYGVTFETGIFTNITEDHISEIEHPTMEDYLHCKIQLLKNSKNVILYRDIDFYDVICKECEGKPIITYGSDDRADYYYTDAVKTEKGFKFNAVNKKKNYCEPFEIKMYGRFNILNAMAAIAFGKENGIDDESIRRALLKTYVQGRMDVYNGNYNGNDITVIVDYAHNSISFLNLYKEVKEDFPNRRIVTVGGTHGGKAFNRRKQFGEIVGANSDYIYITALDPQYEDVVKICKDIAAHIEDQSKYEIIPDRKEAVEKAISTAKAGDVILILGKGEETYQRVNGMCEKYESDLGITKRMLNVK